MPYEHKTIDGVRVVVRSGETPWYMFHVEQNQKEEVEMKRRVVVKESGNGYICTLQVLNDNLIQIMEKEMLVVGEDMKCLGEAVIELFRTRVRDRKKKAGLEPETVDE